MSDAPAAPRPGPSARKAFLVGVFVGLMLAAFAVVAIAALRKSDRPTVDPAVSAAFLAGNRTQPGVVETPSGLQYRVLRPGTGRRPTDADVVQVTYVGTLTDGTVFDRSDTPVTLTVAGVVPGFAEALKLMPEGARYRVWIKPDLGYGANGAGPIPPNAVLVFDIDLRAIDPSRRPR